MQQRLQVLLRFELMECVTTAAHRSWSALVRKRKSRMLREVGADQARMALTLA
jgi:hypothetical protein